MNSKKNYLFVAPAHWQHNRIKFRRHRIVEFLLKENIKNKIYWIYPAVNNENKFIIDEVEHRITCVGIKTSKFKNYIKDFMRQADIDSECILWFTFPAFKSLISMHRWKKIIYDCSDLWGAPWEKQKKINILVNEMLANRREKYIIKNASTVFATSDFLAKHLKTLYTQKKINVIENGVDYNHYIKKEDKLFKEYDNYKIGFVGGLKKKIDFDLIKLIADKMTKAEIFLIGPIDQNVSSLVSQLKSTNVHLLGEIDHTLVPKYIKSLDLGLLPYREIRYNKAVSPLKLFEYLAGGIPVVAKGLPSIVKYQKKGVLHCCQTNSEYLREVQYCLSLVENKELIAERKKLAKQNDWNIKLKEMFDKIF